MGLLVGILMLIAAFFWKEALYLFALIVLYVPQMIASFVGMRYVNMIDDKGKKRGRMYYFMRYLNVFDTYTAFFALLFIYGVISPMPDSGLCETVMLGIILRVVLSAILRFTVLMNDHSEVNENNPFFDRIQREIPFKGIWGEDKKPKIETDEKEEEDFKGFKL